MVLATAPAAVNSANEYLGDVNIHVLANEDGVTIEVAAIEWVGFWETSRTLLTLTTEPSGMPAVDDWAYLSELNESLSEWNVTPKIEKLIRAAAAAAVEIVEDMDQP